MTQGGDSKITVSGTFTSLGGGWIKASLTLRVDGAEAPVEGQGVGIDEAIEAAFSRAIDQLGISTIEELKNRLDGASLQALKSQPPEPRHGL